MTGPQCGCDSNDPKETAAKFRWPPKRSSASKNAAGDFRFNKWTSVSQAGAAVEEVVQGLAMTLDTASTFA